MLRSCQYCGRVHDTTYICPQKEAAVERRENRSNTHKADAASTHVRHKNYWKKLSKTVRHRDMNLCLCCKAKLEGTVRQYNTEKLSVHHIVPINEDETKAFDQRNLITVCQVHHDMCEKGQISREKQRKLVRESIRRNQL